MGMGACIISVVLSVEGISQIGKDPRILLKTWDLAAAIALWFVT